MMKRTRFRSTNPIHSPLDMIPTNTPISRQINTLAAVHYPPSVGFGSRLSSSHRHLRPPPPSSPTVSVTVLESTLIVPISALLRIIPEMSIVAIASRAAFAVVHLRIAPSPSVHLRRIAKRPLPRPAASSTSSTLRRVAIPLLRLSIGLSSPTLTLPHHAHG